MESPRWFKENGLVIFAIATIIGWKAFGYNLIVLVAAMASVPKELIEAAKLENASNWTIFRKIIVPMTSPHGPVRIHHHHHLRSPVYAGSHQHADQGGPNQGSSNIVYIVYQYALVFFQTGKSGCLCHGVHGHLCGVPAAEIPFPGQTGPL